MPQTTTSDSIADRITPEIRDRVAMYTGKPCYPAQDGVVDFLVTDKTRIYVGREPEKILVEFQSETALANLRDVLHDLPGVNSWQGRVSELLWVGAKPLRQRLEGDERPMIYFPIDNGIQADELEGKLMRICDALTRKDYQTVPPYFDADERRRFLGFKVLAADLSQRSQIDHEIHCTPGLGTRALYPLKENVAVTIRQGGAYHNIHVDLPSGKLANRVGRFLIQLGQVPTVRALGHTSPSEGIHMLKSDLNAYSETSDPIHVSYHADWTGEETYLMGGLCDFFGNIMRSPIADLRKVHPGKSYKDHIVYE
jgi:hypothetical protein